MIKVIIEEKAEGNLGIITTKITFFGVTIYNCKRTTTNYLVIKQLLAAPITKPVKGFSNEAKNKNKKVK